MGRSARWLQASFVREGRAAGRAIPAAALRLWNTPAARLRLAYAAAVVFAVAGTVSVLSASGRAPTSTQSTTTAAPAAAAPALVSEAAPPDAGRAWSVTKVWQGSGSRETEAFAVGAHWRVDWLFAPAQSGASLQVFIYSLDGRVLMDLAANTQQSGASSSFWSGAGRYYLKVNASGGDWKVAVQDLR